MNTSMVNGEPDGSEDGGGGGLSCMKCVGKLTGV